MWLIKRKLPWFLLFFVIILLDQFTKYLARMFLVEGASYKVFPFLNFALNFNRGAAFSFLASQSGWQMHVLAIISLVVAIIFIVALLRLPASEKLQAFCLSLIIGGALGNFIDRAFSPHVTDFIDFHLGDWHYATFNAADAAVCIGVVLWLLKIIWEGRSK